MNENPKLDKNIKAHFDELFSDFCILEDPIYKNLFGAIPQKILN